MVALSPPGQIGAGTYDPGTSQFTRITGRVGYFDMIFGAPELLFEMKSMIDYPEFLDGVDQRLRIYEHRERKPDDRAARGGICGVHQERPRARDARLGQADRKRNGSTAQAARGP